MKRHRPALSFAESLLESYKQHYVSGLWSLDDLERIIEGALRTFTFEDWARS